jgi:hypothetical protein
MRVLCYFGAHQYAPVMRGIYIDGGTRQVDIVRCVYCGKLRLK